MVALPRPVEAVNRALRDDFGLLRGYDLGRDDSRLERHMLLAVTEMNPHAAIDRLADALARVAR